MILSSIFAVAELNYSRSTWILSLEFYPENINYVPDIEDSSKSAKKSLKLIFLASRTNGVI